MKADAKSGVEMAGISREGLSVSGLEQVYDALATAIDAAGAENTPIFLVKLALLNAQALGDPELIQQHIDAALKDL